MEFGKMSKFRERNADDEVKEQEQGSKLKSKLNEKTGRCVTIAMLQPVLYDHPLPNWLKSRVALGANKVEPGAYAP